MFFVLSNTLHINLDCLPKITSMCLHICIQVIGVECPRLGEDVCAWIKLEPSRHPLTAEDIQTFCKDKVIDPGFANDTYYSFNRCWIYTWIEK